MKDNEDCPNCTRLLKIATQVTEQAINPPMILVTDKGEYISHGYYERLKAIDRLGLWGRIKWALKPRGK